ncbi:MAG: rod shape-determining protein [Candidatus Coproplasma sp.]
MNRIVIDLGSWNTKIYMLGCGVVLSEATCIAVEEEGGKVKIKAFGDTARALSGKAALNTKIVNPVCEGDIVRPDLMCELLKYYLEKIEITGRKIRQTEVLFIVPCSADRKLRSKYISLADDCGIGRVYFTRTPYATVLGHNVTLSKTTPVFSVDVGYGKTEIAVFSLDGIISGITVNLGGGNVDVHVTELLAENFSVRIGSATAEKIKNTVGSLLEDDNRTLVVGGRDIATGKPTQSAVESYDLDKVIKLYVDKICEYVRAVLSDLPGEVSCGVAESGVYLSGGLTKMDGFADYVSKKLELPVNVCEEPALASVIGGCTILSEPYLSERLITEE